MHRSASPCRSVAPSPYRRSVSPITASLFVLLLGLVCASPLWAVDERSFDLEGFTEPYRKVQVATSESGLVAEIKFRVGDRVEAGDVLATLESSEHVALLEMAKHQAQALGRLESTQAEATLRAARLRKLDELAAQGFAHQDELQRARMESQIADANVLAAKEELVARSLELKKIEAQIAKRTVKAPRSGVIIEQLKQPGEFIGAGDPHVAVLVVLEQLLATFSVPQNQAAKLSVGQSVKVAFAGNGEGVLGVIEVITPVTDAESGTVRVQVLLDNESGTLRSGDRCSLTLD